MKWKKEKNVRGKMPTSTSLAAFHHHHTRNCCEVVDVATMVE
jgi:hypothetical protein